MHYRQIHYIRGYEKSNLKSWIIGNLCICQNTCFFGKRPELSQEKSGTMFFKVRSQFFFGISKTFLIHHKLYPQDDHPLNFFVKKSWFSIFFDNFFYQFCRQIVLTNIFHKNFFLNGHYEGNAYAELKFFQKFWKKLISGLKKHCSGCFLKQPGSFFKQASILSHRFHTQ